MKIRRKQTAFLIGMLLLGFMGLQLFGMPELAVYAGETFVHPDFKKPKRRTLITIETLDTMAKLPGGLSPLPVVSVPADNPMTPAKLELGKMLFFDPRLSGNDHWSCATCHSPGFGYSDNLRRALGFGDETELGRHSPTVLNAAYNTFQFWDGRAKTLEEQAVGPIQAPREMNGDPDEVLAKLNAIPEYRERFMDVFGEPPSLENIGKAIAAFERTLVTRDSPFDRYMQGDKEALTTQQKRGMILFISKASCTQCHNGHNFTDNQFHNLGVPQVGPAEEDLGRFAVTGDEADKRAFKTPTLRNIALTPPYMHNGAFMTLEEVVEFYNKGGGDDPHRTSKLLPLRLTEREKQDLVAFLDALTGNLPIVSYPNLPQVSTASAK